MQVRRLGPSTAVPSCTVPGRRSLAGHLGDRLSLEFLIFLLCTIESFGRISVWCRKKEIELSSPLVKPWKVPVLVFVLLLSFLYCAAGGRVY